MAEVEIRRYDIHGDGRISALLESQVDFVSIASLYDA
jgi:hypothetical protein